MSDKPRINTPEHGDAFPWKYAVYRVSWAFSKNHMWEVYLGPNDYFGEYATHAEALAVAIKEAGA